MTSINRLTERQKLILFTIINEYNETAQPVSSKLLCKKYKLNLSSASLRNEMYFLNKLGYLFQPHISSGRVPTNKALRLLIDGIFNDFQKKNDKITKFDNLENYFSQSSDYSDDEIFYNISRTLSVLSKHFVISGVLEEQTFFKYGLKDLFIQPEFQISRNLTIMSEIIDNIDNKIEQIAEYCNEIVNVFIGKEIPFNRKLEDFSLLAIKCNYKKKNNAIVAILGPKRMDYRNNIFLINSINKFLKKYDK